MRKQRFWWTYLVGCIVCVVYGGWTLIYHLRKGNGLSVHALILLIIGSVLLVLFFVLYLYTLIRKQKADNKKTPEESEPSEDTNTEEIVEDASEKPEEDNSLDDGIEYASLERIRPEHMTHRSSSTSSGGSSIYINLVGSGPILRVEGSRIYDMRNNTYYRIEGNMVKQEGSGPVFEISGNRIRAAFGSYLYEISGSNVNKVFGGYFASINSGKITKHDLSEIYEISGSLNLSQQLAVVALIFGTY